MKIAIHHKKGLYSERWISYCEKEGIAYKIVDCYSNNIVSELEDCTILLWHHLAHYYRDKLFAKQLLFSLETAGKTVFPDIKTTWHYDDKVGQKYLLESIKAPFVPTYIFYTKKEVLLIQSIASFFV